MRGPSLPGLSENAMERAYSPWILCVYAQPWRVAPGWYEAGLRPLEWPPDHKSREFIEKTD